MIGGWKLRYRPGTHLAARFGDDAVGSWPTEADAEAVRRACPNADLLEVVPTT